MYGGLGCAECGGVCEAPKGMGGIDLSTLGWEDYLLMGIVGMGLYAVVSPDSSLFSPKPKRRKRKKSGGGFAFGTVLTLALVGGVGYLIYSSNA